MRAAPSLPLWRVERILGDEAGVLVVDKPPGVPVHGGDESLPHSLIQRLERYLESEGRDRYLAVHQRLDQETSGAIAFVTEKERNAEFSAAMENHQVERVYQAVVAALPGAKPLADERRIEVWITHDRGRSQVAAGKPGKGAKGRDKAKRAVTHVKVLQRHGDRALVDVRLETGRTHQIRATMAFLGHPVVGDRIYGGAPAFRLMLHAHRLSGGPLGRTHEAPVPECFSQELVLEGGFPTEPRELLRDAATLRASLASHTNTYRLVNGAGDGLPGMTVDAYGAFAVLNLYEESLLGRSSELADEVAQLGFSGVYIKHRVRADLRKQSATELAPEGPAIGHRAPTGFLVEENGMQVSIDLDDGLSTGLFVDMRDNRFRARSWARGGRMLNLFCYTSSFSVSAALSGATTTNVDLSGRALDRSRTNFEANGLDQSAHRFFKEDAMKFLARAVRRGDQYDFIVLDPPSFSTVGKGTFSVKSKYGQAAADCFRLLSKGGRLLCVTNHTKTTPRAFRKTVEAAAEAAGRKLQQLKELKPGIDCPPHPEGPWPSKSLLAEIA